MDQKWDAARGVARRLSTLHSSAAHQKANVGRPEVVFAQIAPLSKNLRWKSIDAAQNF
jgi:hypothetical protein